MITDARLKIITAAIAVFGLIFSVIKYVQVQEIEAAKPYLEKKLAWCEEAVEIASSIANSKDPTASQEKRFWELYWGVIGMVEKQEITDAMIAFGHELELGGDLKEKSLSIAHACRTELAEDWSPQWAL